MKSLLALAMLVTAGSAMLPRQAQAIGCLSGAAIGGVGGHYAGHHAILGAAAGCAIGHHAAVVRRRNAAAAAAAQQNGYQTQGSYQPDAVQQ